MNIIKRINIGISVAVIAACAGLLLLFGWSGTGWKALSIPTGSMRPGMPPGSLVLVHRVPASSLKVGDVITYTSPRDTRITITHRIIKTYKLGGRIPAYVTKGDANNVADIPIVSGEVNGKVLWHAPHLGYVLMDAKKPLIILPIVYLAALLVMIEEVQRLAQYYRRWAMYRLPGYRREPENDHAVSKRVAIGGALATAFVVVGLAFSPVALAAIKSNTVILAKNKISVAKICDNKGQNKNDKNKCNNNGNGGNCGADKNSNNTKNCNQQCTGTNTVIIGVTTNQNATTGSANSTSGGNATSGNASNSSSTTININGSNC